MGKFNRYADVPYKRMKKTMSQTGPMQQALFLCQIRDIMQYASYIQSDMPYTTAAVHRLITQTSPKFLI